MKALMISIVLTLLLVSNDTEPQNEFQSNNFELIKLGDRLYSCVHEFGGKTICNVGIVDNGKETKIFDSFLSPGVAAELLDALDELKLSPVKYVVNSHSHNDRIRGNEAFPEEVRINSTPQTKELIESEEALRIPYGSLKSTDSK